MERENLRKELLAKMKPVIPIHIGFISNQVENVVYMMLKVRAWEFTLVQIKKQILFRIWMMQGPRSLHSTLIGLTVCIFNYKMGNNLAKNH